MGVTASPDTREAVERAGGRRRARPTQWGAPHSRHVTRIYSISSSITHDHESIMMIPQAASQFYGFIRFTGLRL